MQKSVPITRAGMKTLAQFTPVEITWEDAYATTGDRDGTHIEANMFHCLRYTLGYVIRADMKQVVIAGTDDRHSIYESTNKPVADITTIPTGMVRRVLPLGKPRRD